MRYTFYAFQILSLMLISSCKDTSASSAPRSSDSEAKGLVGNAYVDEKHGVLYITDDKYAKNNYAIKRDKVQLIEYRIDGNKFIYDDMLGKTILEISDDQSRIYGNCGVLQLDLKKTDPATLDPTNKLLFGLTPK